MTLEKAIDRLTQIERFSNYPFMPGDREALRLDIEAVKAWKQFQESLPPQLRSLLPGETKE